MIKIKGNLLQEFAKLAKDKGDEAKKALVTELQAATPVDTGYAKSRWEINSDGDIVNDAEYIERLNAGSSQQAPAYFIEQTLLSHPGVKPNGTIVRDIT
jgi:hypothetical protein